MRCLSLRLTGGSRPPCWPNARGCDGRQEGQRYDGARLEAARVEVADACGSQAGRLTEVNQGTAKTLEVIVILSMTDE